MVRGWRTHNRPIVRTVGAVAPGAGFSHFKLRVCQVHLTRVRFVDAETTRLKGGLPGGLTSSFFDRLRCQKSPDRGFGMLGSHWSSRFVSLSIVRHVFLTLFEQLIIMIHWKLDQEM